MLSTPGRHHCLVAGPLPGCHVWQYLRHTSWAWAVPGEASALNPVTVNHPCTARLQADPMFSGSGCQSLQPASLHAEPTCRWASAEAGKDLDGKECCQPSRSEILLGSEELQMEMISRVVFFQLVCYGHARKGSPPRSLRHNLLRLIRPSLWGKYQWLLKGIHHSSIHLSSM